ncbi:hypothetical protein [Mesorhizobium opportunistum]|uniref:Uncharacterized protein n=1 Tax=Mesorhizobium opportunistum TaxID=593909 RepID=A0ABV1YP71_9HYPH
MFVTEFICSPAMNLPNGRFESSYGWPVSRPMTASYRRCPAAFQAFRHATVSGRHIFAISPEGSRIPAQMVVEPLDSEMKLD